MKKLLIVLALALSATALGIACGGAQTPVDRTIQDTGGNGYGGATYGGSEYGGATYGTDADGVEELDDGADEVDEGGEDE